MTELTEPEMLVLADALRTEAMFLGVATNTLSLAEKADRMNHLLSIARKNGIDAKPAPFTSPGVEFVVPGYVAPPTVKARDLQPGETIRVRGVEIDVVDARTTSGAITYINEHTEHHVRFFASDNVEVVR